MVATLTKIRTFENQQEEVDYALRNEESKTNNKMVDVFKPPKVFITHISL